MSYEAIELALEDAPSPVVSAAVHAPVRQSGPAVLLTPGAGGSYDGAPLTGLADVLASLGCTVVRANLPHHQLGRRAPRAESSVPGYRAVLAAARAQVAPQASWVAGGKSYGGRVATLAAVDDALEVAGLILHGYPLHPPGKPDQLRVDHWHRIPIPVLFLQGTRDPFGSAHELEEHLTKLPRRATLLAVEGGDHTLDVAGVHAPDGVRRPAAEVLERSAEPIATWLRVLADS
ncbi:MAG: alpha/beta family hydrolase [Nitriliruptor sp.]